MALVTNRCKKHHTAHPENECPICVREEAEKQREDSIEFFKKHGNEWVRLRRGSYEGAVSVEDLYKHFRARLLDELTPVLRNGKKSGE